MARRGESNPSYIISYWIFPTIWYFMEEKGYTSPLWVASSAPSGGNSPQLGLLAFMVYQAAVNSCQSKLKEQLGWVVKPFSFLKCSKSSWSDSRGTQLTSTLPDWIEISINTLSWKSLFDQYYMITDMFLTVAHTYMYEADISLISQYSFKGTNEQFKDEQMYKNNPTSNNHIVQKCQPSISTVVDTRFVIKFGNK